MVCVEYLYPFTPPIQILTPCFPKADAMENIETAYDVDSDDEDGVDYNDAESIELDSDLEEQLMKASKFGKIGGKAGDKAGDKKKRKSDDEMEDEGENDSRGKKKARR